MSNREQVHTMVDEMSEEQLEELVTMIKRISHKRKTAKSLRGALSKYAKPELIPSEEGAWERAVTENYENP